MRKYETVFISDPDLNDQARSELFERIKNILIKENGTLINFDQWGEKKLAYAIKKKFRGYYVCMTYAGTGDTVKEIERNFRLSEDIIKFMTILLSDNMTQEELIKEIEFQQSQQNPSETSVEDEEEIKTSPEEENI